MSATSCQVLLTAHLKMDIRVCIIHCYRVRIRAQRPQQQCNDDAGSVAALSAVDDDGQIVAMHEDAQGFRNRPLRLHGKQNHGSVPSHNWHRMWSLMSSLLSVTGSALLEMYTDYAGLSCNFTMARISYSNVGALR